MAMGAWAVVLQRTPQPACTRFASDLRVGMTAIDSSEPRVKGIFLYTSRSVLLLEPYQAGNGN